VEALAKASEDVVPAAQTRWRRSIYLAAASAKADEHGT